MTPGMTKARTRETEALETDQEGDTNFDDELRPRKWKGESCPIQKPRSSGGMQQRGSRAFFGGATKAAFCPHPMAAIQPGALGVIAAEPDPRVSVALNAGNILNWMLQQASIARGLAPPNHPSQLDPYPPLSPSEAQERSRRLVDEVTTHCDILGEGEITSGHSPTHTPARRARPRTEGRASSADGQEHCSIKQHSQTALACGEVEIQPPTEPRQRQFRKVGQIRWKGQKRWRRHCQLSRGSIQAVSSRTRSQV